ncbi:Bromodomain-containing protein [Sporodiniella umbellata]|nr:Bromodomain-containing protein [Sporodiniella umbellata]
METTPINNTSTFKSAADGLPSPPAQKPLPLGVQPITKDQTKYCAAIMRNLKKHRDASPFLNPVDYIKLNIPDYPQIVKRPMDLLLVDQKLNGCEYAAVDEFIADVRLVFNNCFKYNGPEAMISVLCQNVESAFEKGLRQMPPGSDALSPPLSQHSSPHEEQPDYYDRPKREIHMPSKDYPETFTVASPKGMKYCLQTVKELKKQKYRHLSFPFLYPVDPVALNIPDYPTIVQHPMDLHTIEQKLNKNDYQSPDEFAADVHLMFDNCYLYNPPQLPIHTMAKQFQAVFEEKWDQRPPIEPVARTPLPNSPPHKKKNKPQKRPDKEQDKIAELERHIATISQQIQSIKSTQPVKKKRAAPRSLPNKKESPKKKKRMTKYREMSSDEEEEKTLFTFQQKKQLSETISQLPEDRLAHIAQIIQASMPHLGNDEEEIELDIDSLDLTTLTQLHNYVYYESTDPPKKQNGLKTTPQGKSSPPFLSFL